MGHITVPVRLPPCSIPNLLSLHETFKVPSADSPYQPHSNETVNDEAECARCCVLETCPVNSTFQPGPPVETTDFGREFLNFRSFVCEGQFVQTALSPGEPSAKQKSIVDTAIAGSSSGDISKPERELPCDVTG
jgi:hypothetical protein